MPLSEIDLSQIIENSLSEIYVVDLESLRFIYSNERARTNLGYSAEEFLTLSPRDVMLKASAAEISEIVARLRADPHKGRSTATTFHLRKDGSSYPVEADIQKATWNDRPALFVSATDISDRQKTLDQLIAVMRGAALGYWDLDFQTGKFEVNERWLEMLGRTHAEFDGETSYWRGQVHPADYAIVEGTIKDCIANDKPYVIEFRMRHKDGHWVWIQESGAVISRDPASRVPLRICGTHMDISQRKQTELEREEFHTFFQLAQDIMVIADPKGNFRKVNPAATRILGWSEAELLSRPWEEFIHPDDRTSTHSEVAQQVATGMSMNFENRLLCKDGSWRWVSWHSSFDEPSGLGFGTARDITDYKRMVEDINKKEETYRALAENSQDVIMLYDRAHRHTYANKAAIPLIGIAPEEFIGKTHEEMGFAPELCKLWGDSIERVFETGVSDPVQFEVSSPQGPAMIDWRAFPVLNAAGAVEAVLSVARDITQSRKHEEEIQKAQKLSSLGILAGGIAHDFNNILTIIFGNITLSKSQLPPGHPSYVSLEEAERGFQRASRLTNQLLTFAKGGDPIMKDVSVRRLVEEEIRFDLSGSNVKLVIEADDDLWLAKADKGQLTQVFSNLCFNAIQAMPRGGSLFICMENAVVDADSNMALAPGRYLRFTVRDEGAGIEKHNLARIFDPYFSTKQSGSGLGLATVYSVIQKHGGSIQAESQVGQGTTFVFYLPASELHEEPEESPVSSEPAASGVQARVLLMDDEEMILRLATTVLGSSGFEVDTAPDGRAAVALYWQALADGRPYDCVVMDLTIPGGMGGVEALRELQRMDPNVKAIVSSGYADAPIMAGFAAYGFRAVLVKPFSVQALRTTVRQVLAG